MVKARGLGQTAVLSVAIIVAIWGAMSALGLLLSLL